MKYDEHMNCFDFHPITGCNQFEFLVLLSELKGHSYQLQAMLAEFLRMHGAAVSPFEPFRVDPQAGWI